MKNSSIRQEKPTHKQQGGAAKESRAGRQGGRREVGDGVCVLREKGKKGNVDAAFSLLRFALPNERRSTHKSNAKLHYFVISGRPIHCHCPPPPALPSSFSLFCPAAGHKTLSKINLREAKAKKKNAESSRG